jgi:hypothetical protein
MAMDGTTESGRLVNALKVIGYVWSALKNIK